MDNKFVISEVKVDNVKSLQLNDSAVFMGTAKVIADLVMDNKIYFDIVTDYHKREVAPYSYEYRNTIKTYSQDTGRCVE